MSNTKEFKTILSVAETILTEIKIEMDNDGLRFRGLNGGHTSFIEVNFKKSYFDTYKLTEIDNILLDTTEINKIFKRIKNDDDTTIIIDKDTITIRVDSNENTKSFKLNGIDMEYDSPSIPNISYSVTFDVDFKEFKDNVTDSSLYEDKLRIKTYEDNLIIYNKGVIGSYESNIKLIGNQKECSSVFSLDLVDKLFKLTTVSNTLNISMGNDMPMLFCLNDSFEELFIRYLIAPRIEE